MSDGELLDAREAMSLLGVNETDLQTMVARGSLRAFRSAGTMKFRRDDVLGIKAPDKKTEPTIIAASAPSRTKPGSGILPTVASNKSPRGSSRNLPAIRPTITAAAGAAAGVAAARAAAPKPPPPPVDTSTSSDQIILEEFELSPSENDAANTQQVTASNAAVSGGVTVVDAGLETNLETGNQTVVEQGIDIDTASATASAIAPVAVSMTGSGRMKVPSSRLNDPAIANAPAMSRVRAAVGVTSQSAATKRATASATTRTSHPIMTLILILTAYVYIQTATTVGVQLFKGNYDPETHQRVIPPFLTGAYGAIYPGLPGTPEDTEGEFKRPKEEPAPTATK